MKWLPIAAKFPKWAFACGIIAISATIFICWWIFRSPNKPTRQSQTVAAAPIRKTADFDLAEVVLCGNTLVNS